MPEPTPTTIPRPTEVAPSVPSTAAVAPAPPVAPPTVPPVVGATPAPAPGPAPVSVPVPAAPADNLTMQSPIEYEETDGTVIRTTVGELINKHSEFKGVDPTQMHDVMGAMNNDKDSMKRLLEGQLAKMNEGVQNATPEGQRIHALEEQITELRTMFSQTQPVMATVEDAQLTTQVNAMLVNEAVKKQFPWLTAKPEFGSAVAKKYIKALRDAAKAQNVDVSGRQDLLVEQLKKAEAYAQQVGSIWGGQLPTAPVGPAVVAEQGTPSGATSGVVRKATFDPVAWVKGIQTPGFNGQGHPVPPGTLPSPAGTVVPAGVPETGGTQGSAHVAESPVQTGRFSSNELLAHMKQQTATAKQA